MAAVTPYDYYTVVDRRSLSEESQVWGLSQISSQWHRQHLL